MGGSIGAAVGPSGLASVPYVGWVLAGAATMLGMEQGAENRWTVWQNGLMLVVRI